MDDTWTIMRSMLIKGRKRGIVITVNFTPTEKICNNLDGIQCFIDVYADLTIDDIYYCGYATRDIKILNVDHAVAIINNSYIVQEAEEQLLSLIREN